LLLKQIELKNELKTRKYRTVGGLDLGAFSVYNIAVLSKGL